LRSAALSPKYNNNNNNNKTLLVRNEPNGTYRAGSH